MTWAAASELLRLERAQECDQLGDQQRRLAAVVLERAQDAGLELGTRGGQRRRRDAATRAGETAAWPARVRCARSARDAAWRPAGLANDGQALQLAKSIRAASELCRTLGVFAGEPAAQCHAARRA